MSLRTLTTEARALTEPLTLLTLERNDVEGALTVAKSLKEQGRLDSGMLQILVQMQDKPALLESQLAVLVEEAE